MAFESYQHICKFNSVDVENIELGVCYVFPKLDGTNCSVWFEDGEIKVGSRNRELSIINDNAGSCNALIRDARLQKFFEKYPDLRLYGEWLIPHTIKGYRDDAWRKFYVFDVVRGKEDIENLDIIKENYGVEDSKIDIN